VGLDDASAQGQTQAGAWDLGVDAIERLENPGQVLFVQAKSNVVDRNLQYVTVLFDK
jgi:hypothetical protein